MNDLYVMMDGMKETRQKKETPSHLAGLAAGCLLGAFAAAAACRIGSPDMDMQPLAIYSMMLAPIVLQGAPPLMRIFRRKTLFDSADFLGKAARTAVFVGAAGYGLTAGLDYITVPPEGDRTQLSPPQP